MKIGRSLAIAAAGALLLALPTQAAQATPLATAKGVPAATASPDFDGDNKADVAASVYVPSANGWGARIQYGSGHATTIKPEVLGASLFDMYGPLLARDLNDDGYTDLVLSSGRYSQSAEREGARVTIVLGSEDGLDLSTAHEIVVSTSPNTAPISLALVEAPTPRLAVGMATGTGNGTGSGNVRLYDLDSSGMPVGSPTTLKKGSGKVPTISGSSVGFGSSLAAYGNRLFIGAPYATVSKKTRAGAIVAATLSTTGVSSAKLITQSTKSVTGAAGTQDRFGFSLAALDGNLVVGTPRDDVESLKDTGSVQVFSLASNGLKPVRRVSQATSGVPGKAEANDDFGSSVALGSTCSGAATMVVGGSGEQIGPKNVGSAWLIPVRTGTGCASSQLYPGHGFSGKPKAGVRLGTAVAVVRDKGDKVDDVVVTGSGFFSAGPAGRLLRWSPGAGETFNLNQFVSGIAGR